MTDFAQSVKQQADIVRIIGDYVVLKKSGAQNFTGLCPFHNEKSPSFSVHATRQFFHCFGCGVSGDVFSFVQKIENSTFPEAVRTVAAKMGIALPKQNFSPEEAREASVRGKLLDLHEAACKWFEEQLRTSAGAAAREYLKSRELTEEVIRNFRIGFAPDSGFALRDLLKQQADEAALKQSGIFSWKDEQGGISAMYAKFRNRIIFPICNEQGKVIAFNGRILEGSGTAAEKDKQGPKYLNSPETPIYHKGSVLWNLHKAKEAIRKLDYSIVVEGQMDCVRVYSSGLHNVIASSGTAFSEAQIRLLARYSKNIIVNFDPDTAGAAATERTLALLVEEDFNTRVVALEGGLDPDLFIRRKGVDAYAEVVRGARKYFDYLLARAQQQFAATPEGKVKALNWLLPHIQRVPNRIARDEIASDVAHRLGIDSALLRQELRSAAGARGTREIKASTSAPQVTPAEKLLIHALLADELHPQARIAAHDALAEERPHEGWAAAAIINALLSADADQLADALALPLEDAQRNQLAALLMEPTPELTQETVRVALAALRRPHLERRLREVQYSIDQAARKNESAQMAQLTQEKLALKRALDESMRAGVVTG